MNKNRCRLLLTCEHGGFQVPEKYKYLFESEEAQEILQTHRGWDPGTLEFARSCSQRFEVPLFYSETTRLLVDLNRSLRRRTLFSEFSKKLSAEERCVVLDQYYHPHRNQITRQVGIWLEDGDSVFHVACHSFTPELNGSVRNTEIGLLYDPAWNWEFNLCRRWKHLIQQQAPEVRVRFNYPYLGKNDGLTTHLRKTYPASRYAGIELEINQKFPLGRDPQHWTRVQELLMDTMARLMTGLVEHH